MRALLIPSSQAGSGESAKMTICWLLQSFDPLMQHPSKFSAHVVESDRSNGRLFCDLCRMPKLGTHFKRLAYLKANTRFLPGLHKEPPCALGVPMNGVIDAAIYRK